MGILNVFCKTMHMFEIDSFPSPHISGKTPPQEQPDSQSEGNPIKVATGIKYM